MDFMDHPFLDRDDSGEVRFMDLGRILGGLSTHLTIHMDHFMDNLSI